MVSLIFLPPAVVNSRIAQVNIVKSQILARYLFSYFRTFEKSTEFNSV